MDKIFECLKCKEYYDINEKVDSKNICKNCLKEYKHIYYENKYKTILKEKYTPTGKPRGRPKKIIS